MSQRVRSDLTVSSPIVKHRVYGKYLEIRTRDGQVFFIHQPSLIGYWVKSYVGAGIALIILGWTLLLTATYFTSKAGELADLMPILQALSLLLLFIGIILLFIKEHHTVIETSAGSRIFFRKGLSSEEINEIVKQLVEGNS